MLHLTKGRADGKVRSFCEANYARNEWLTGSARLNRLFCWPCLLFDRSGSLNNPWSTTGFVDLANLARAMERHSKSRGRITSELKLKLFGRVRIDEALDQAAAISVTRHNQQVEKNRAILKRLIAAVLYLGGQEQAFRGHSESTSSSGNRGNFMELVQTFAEFDTTMAEHLSSATAFTGTSKTIQNDIIESTAHVIQEEIDKEINAAPFIAIEVDDTTDISCRCQLTVIVRYVNESGIICERFLGFHDISLERDAETIAAVVMKTIGSYNPETKLICQTYDGASCMSGQRGGVQALVKVKCRHALFVHCYAHKLNLVLAQGTSNIRESRLFFASLDSFHNFFSRSPKRTALLKEVDSIRVLGGSTTRWNFKSRAGHAVHEGRGSLITALDRITAEPGWDKDAIAQSSALRQKLDDFDFMFMLGVFKTIFGLTEPLFQVLQSRALAIRKCEERVNGTLTALKATRSTETFNQLYEETVQAVGMPNQLRRKQRCRAWADFELGVTPDGEHEDTGPVDAYRRLFFQLLDGIVQHMTHRFEDMKCLSFFCVLDNASFKTYSQPAGFPGVEISQLVKTYPVFDELRLRNELQVIYADTLFHKPPAELLKMLIKDELTSALPEVCKLLRLMLTIPVSSTSAERSFSCLKRIKTYLRNSCGQDRLGHLAKISMESSVTQDLKSRGELYDRITTRFATMKDRRMPLLFK
ncbi:zinc finger MYM-type protein 1-like [Halichoeres trimaculatus]|uniref:zinc finger MYM-type protein 1-like n=1 Tax=Halichoeres trimaculatus TaxID=147232 RepID=UPI003D9E02B8